MSEGTVTFRTSMAISPTKADFAPLLFAGDWETAIDVALEQGWDAIEVSVRDPADRAVVECVAAASSIDLSVSAIATGQSYYTDGWSPTNPDAAIRKALRHRFREIVDLASSIESLVVIGGVRGRLEMNAGSVGEQFHRAVDEVRGYAEYAKSNGVDLVIEPINRYETNFLNTVSEVLAFIAELDVDNVYVLPDTFHMNIEEVSLGGSLREAGDSIRHVQFTDSNRLAPGQGHIDFGELTTVLQEIGYLGYLSAEILPEPDSTIAAHQAVTFFHSLTER